MARVIKLKKRWTLGTQRGSGGFGKVFEATNEDGEQAAVKLIEKKPGADRETLIAREVSGLPKVVEVIDDGEDGNEYVLVMPLAERSLEDELAARGGPIPVDDAVAILADISEALAGVHEKKIINRDVKPANTLLIDGSWNLSDFGIGRFLEATTGIETFKFHGSSPYLAPERWRGERASAPSDVYSFGIVAYELLMGRRPFVGPDAADFADQHQHQAPPDLTGAPPKLASLVMECLDKAPAARPPAANILTRLQTIMSPSAPGSNALQAANQAIAADNAALSAKLATARTEKERRDQLAQSAISRLRQIGETLQAQILDAAPASSDSTARTATTGWARSLGPATIFMDEIIPASPDVWGGYAPAFDVIAYSAIGIRIPQDRYGWEGRVHSLWYCDAKEAGDFRWFEIAFMVNPLMRQDSTVAPFALPPGGDSGVAIAPTLGHIQAAWPFLPFDRGDDAEFLERWLRWFGEAAQGELRRPSSMPERSDAHNSWRRS
jgi:serine/threonine protein kinase